MFREEPGVDGSTRWEVMGQDRVQQGTVEGLEEAGVFFRDRLDDSVRVHGGRGQAREERNQG